MTTKSNFNWKSTLIFHTYCIN